MAENERAITTVFKADISQFSASTQELNRYVSQVNSEFKNATASMGKWSDNTDGLNAKVTQLNGVLEAEKKKLASLEDEYNKLTDDQKKNTAQGQKLATAINNQSAKVQECEKNIEHYSSSLKELEDAGVKTKQELDDLNKELDEQKQALKDLGGNVAKGAGVAIAGFGAACVGAFAAISSIVEETKELRTQMGQLETTFTQQGHSADAAKKTYDDLFSVLGDSGKATEASMHLGKLAKNEKELEQMTNTLTGVYATFGDSLPVEALAEAMNGTAKIGSVQGNLADALEWSGVNLDGFNEKLATLNTEEERAKFISETLNGIYGETANKYKEVNADVIAANDAQNKYNQAMAEIGEKAQPIVTEFKMAMVGMLGEILTKFEDVDIEGILGGITDTLVKGFEFVKNNEGWLKAAILGIGAAYLTWNVATMIGTVVNGIKALTTATNLQAIAQKALNLVMSANPIGLIAAAVVGLTVAFVTLWKNCEGFRNFFIGMWENIKSVAVGVGEFLGKIFSGIIGFYKNMINGIIGNVNTAIGFLNKIKIPDWEIFGSYAGKGINIKEIPLLAEGGVIDKPTLAMVGEAGKEVVMPLENNTQWIDKLADKISSKMGNSNVTYNINNKFEKMETSRHALHKSNLELKALLGGAK